jgi:rhodanese-related sulfurtransferase
MRLLKFFIFFSFLNGFSQSSVQELLNNLNKHSVPYISVEELMVSQQKEKVVLLDAREPEEFNVSHLKNAISVGYKHFSSEEIQQKIKNKDQKIIVYCSLGVRSENIGEKLEKMGYTNVHNLFGGIFEWKNNNFSVYNNQEEKTEKVHAFSKKWGKWLKNAEKVY